MLQDNLDEAIKEGLIRGHVTHQETDFSKLVVFALREDGRVPIVANYTSLAHSDGYLMRAGAHKRYLVGVFADRNGNLRADPDEPAAFSEARVEVVADWKRAARADLSLSASSRLPAAIVDALQDLATVKRKPLPLAIGEVAGLDDERFAEDSGRLGMWAPFDFAVHVGSGVYFLGPYDPKKIPVLFVSGIGGFPQQWRPFIESLDASLYQPWVFLYPSGARLQTSAAMLNGCIEALHAQYGFERLYVTAHSMGGLVSRGFIQMNTQSAANRYLRLFVSVSTPWSGHKAARAGVEHSPVVMPSWVDLQPDSEYQQALFARRLAPPLEYELLWGRLDATLPVEQATDGTIDASSQLRLEAVRDARRVHGFVESHTSILRSPEVIAVYLQLLAGAR